MKNIIFITRSCEHAKFFERMNKSLLKMGFQPRFLALSFAAYIYLKIHCCSVDIIRKRRNYPIEKTREVEDINRSLEYKLNKYKFDECKCVYESVFSCLLCIYMKNGIDMIFFFNGSGVSDLAGEYFARKYGIKTLFFEIANFPGKIFVDKLGTNAKSELFYDKGILKKYEITDLSVYEKWRDRYLNQKIKEHLVPQARKTNKLISLVDFFGCIYFFHFEYAGRALKNKYLKIKKRINIDEFCETINYQKEKYIFFPLQVSSDSQIIIHSDVNLLMAIRYAVEEAEKENAFLVIKPHPAEKDMRILKEIIDMKKKKNFLSNENTFKLIKYAQKVITINSTVGLETMIMGKEVKILGRSFYRDFTYDDIARYVLKYLIDIDFFSKEKISESRLLEIINRVEN